MIAIIEVLTIFLSFVVLSKPAGTPVDRIPNILLRPLGGAIGGPYGMSSITTPSSTIASNQRALPAIKVEPSGRVYTTQILKQQLANELGLPLRDLRIVDPTMPNQIQATFTSRKQGKDLLYQTLN